MKELRKAVFRCDGKRTAEEIRTSIDIFQAVDIVCEFFSKRRILVIVDNVWDAPVKSKVVSWAVTLANVGSFPDSAVIVTTRLALLSESSGFDRVDLDRLDLVTEGSPDWPVAEQLYYALLDAKPDDRISEMYAKDREKALKLTCGLPLAIKTFTGVVRSRLRVGDDVSSVLTKSGQRAISLGRKSVGEDMSAVTRHPGLFAAMEESLAFLDERKGCRVKSAPLAGRKDAEGNNSRLFSASYGGLSDRRLSSRYAALGVMPASSTNFSLQVLCRLWHLRNVEETEEIALMFVNVGLGRLQTGSLRQDRVLCLHDLHYEFCAGMCDASLGATDDSGTGSLSSLNGHALLLSSCESLLDAEKDGDAIGMGWVTFCYSNVLGLPEQIIRQYLSQNLLRHLCAAVVVMDADGVRRTICNLLSDFRWVRGRMAGDGRASVLSDCDIALAARIYASTNSSDHSLVGTVRLFTRDTEKSIQELRQSLMFVGEAVSAEYDGTLAGSLIQLCQSSTGSGDAELDDVLFRNLACSSESDVRGPWLKPINGCSRTWVRDVLSQAVVGGGARVNYLAALGDGIHFVSGSADGAVRVHDRKYLDAILELKGHGTEVKCGDLAKKEGEGGSFLLFSGNQDGTVRCWEIEHDTTGGVIERATAVVGICGRPVWCLSVSQSGDVVAAGCHNGLVCIWKRQDGDAAFLYEPVDSFRCSAFEEGLGNSGLVRGVAVSRSGDLVVAGEIYGGIAFWSAGGIGMERTLGLFCTGHSDESGAQLRHVFLSEDDDESSVTFVFNEPAGCEVWNVAQRRRRSPRVAIPGFEHLACATFGDTEKVCAAASGERNMLVAGGWKENVLHFVSLHSPSDDFKVISKYPLDSTPRSVCCTSFSGSKRILIGSDDGCVRMLDADVSVTSDVAEPFEGGTRSLGSGCIDASDTPELEAVSAVAVMPTAGFITAGHADGRFSLWRAESGEYVRAFGDGRGNWVSCVDICAAECLAVSGHGDGVALIWNASTWECGLSLVGYSKPVICATISADAKRIITVDWSGELRFWDAQSGGAALRTTKTGHEFSSFGSRSASSFDGELFLWATKDCRGQKWLAKVIDFGSGSLIWKCEEARYSDWDALFKKMMSSEAFGGKKKVLWRPGAVWCNRSVELRDADSGQQLTDEWRILSGGAHADFLPRIDCASLPADGGTIDAAASLSFDRDVLSIAAEWTPREVGRCRRAVVACQLRNRSRPAIMHFYPAKE